MAAMTISIESVGIPVERCATGAGAIDLIRQKRYAVIVIDLMLLTGLGGLDLECGAHGTALQEGGMAAALQKTTSATSGPPITPVG